MSEETFFTTILLSQHLAVLSIRKLEVKLSFEDIMEASKYIAAR